MIGHGTLLQNRYRVSQQTAKGGMGAVYLALDERFHSTVAIKETFFFDNPTLRKAFEREAHLLNHLRHAALPKVSDHFIEGNGQYLVMEFIQGADLAQLLQERGGALPLADVLRWADELLDALDYLHTQNPPVIHRDIKPQNIKLTPRGQIILLDFGLAKGTPEQMHGSVAHSIVGYSPHYASLEQVHGAGTDACSDLYSLGATLYHLLTGIMPVATLTRASAFINNQPDPLVPVHIANPLVPLAVSKVIQSAMAQKSTMRPRSAAVMREMLRQAAKALPHSITGAAHTAHSAPHAIAVADAPTASGETTITEFARRAPFVQQARTAHETTVEAAAHKDKESLGEGIIKVATHVQSMTKVATHVPTSHEPHARKLPAKLLVIAAVLVLCAAAALTLRPVSNSPVAKVEAQADNSLNANASAPLDANAQAQTATTTSNANASENPAASVSASPTPEVIQSSTVSPANAAPATTNAPAPVAAQTPVATNNVANNPPASNEHPATPAVSAPTENPPVPVAQKPAQNQQPAFNNADFEEATRRTAEMLKRSMAGQQPNNGQPPPMGGWPPPQQGGSSGGFPPPRPRP